MADSVESDRVDEPLEPAAARTTGAEAARRPVDIEKLETIVSGYRAQANALRRTARLNILSIIATVLLMTVLVLVLPPLVNVVEDKLLAAFGYQTSQIDFQRETARQAADVRARSQKLLDLLEERDGALETLTRVLSVPLSAFRPEYIIGLQRLDDPVVVDFVEFDNARIAVGGSSRSPNRAPLLASWDPESETWISRQAIGPFSSGILHDLATGGDMQVAVGMFDNFAVAFERSSQGQWRLLDARPSQMLSSRAPPQLLGAIVAAVSPDGVNILMGGPFGIEALRGPAMPQVAGTTIDMIWRDSILYVLSHQSPEIQVHAVDFSQGTPQVDSQTLEFVHAIPLEFEDRGFGDPALFIVDETNALRRLERGPDGMWRTGGLADNEPLGDAGFVQPSTFVSGPTLVWGGGGQKLVAVTTDRRGPQVSEVALRSSAADNVEFFHVHADNDGTILLSPQIIAPSGPRRLRHPILYADHFVRPEKAVDDPVLLAFLEGDDPAMTGALLRGDATAEAKGLVGGRSSFSASVSSALEPYFNGWFLSEAAYSSSETLLGLSVQWEQEWDNRERAATTLARLRSADLQSDLWRNVSSLAARLAVVALLIYLVNILVNLYRYNMRLAAFYQARGDAVDMALTCGADLTPMVGTSLAELARAQTPEQVTFGSRPAPPTEAILKTAQELAKVARPGSG